MITIDQLLESVDLDFEPRWITKDDENDVNIWANKPEVTGEYREYWCADGNYVLLEKLKLTEFEGKDWTECIYEVPRKTTGKIEKLERHIEMNNGSVWSCPPSSEEFMYKINELVDAINGLKGAKNE